MTLALMGLGLVAFPLALLCFAFWIWMRISAIRNPNLGETEKICWVLAIIFLQIIGALLYFFIAHSSRSKPTTA
jgi:Phospholipase_D-nuclease N-terminal